jgi:hypothetical protein
MEAVIEVPMLDRVSMPSRPVARLAPGSWLVLNADRTDEQVGPS